ncbi:unnamed protein product [Dovyalis caffra]|uniref:FYVE-type domain-containing protein n=1 Tax=Dovyalis caffra TaxID=77055 RepID=A0AAV1RGU5_9ROSI|nr:unnamed protein product [Dovyalis caffra]
MQQNYEYYYQSQFQSPNHPSAPPVPSSYCSSDYSSYENHNHVPSPGSYHDQFQTPPNYDPSLNFGYERTNKLVFDDYGRPINLQVGPGPVPGSSGKASPEMETQADGKSGVQKFRVMMLAEGGNQSDINVTCQIGLEGVRMLDPASGRTLKIYPLDTVTRWEVLDSSVFVFSAKSSIDVQPRCIRLKSNSYTTNAILDALTAATVQTIFVVEDAYLLDLLSHLWNVYQKVRVITGLMHIEDDSGQLRVQLKEMGGKHLFSDSSKVSDQSTEKKKRIADWMKLVKPINEEKVHWVPDEAVSKCMACSNDFSAFARKHHCRNCGNIFCDKCTQGRIALTTDEEAQPVRVCDQCMAEVTQRLSNAREPSEKIVGTQNDGDLAKKLQPCSVDTERDVVLGECGGGYSTNCPVMVLVMTYYECITNSEELHHQTLFWKTLLKDHIAPKHGGEHAIETHEEIERSRRPSSGLNSDRSDKQMREVACPTCTVHLQVPVPTSGSETIECSVCQYPFLLVQEFEFDK